MCVCVETGMCLERLEHFQRRAACVYVCEEREMCLCQERESCMGVCLYREEADVFGVKDGFFLYPCSCGKTGLCVYICLFITCVYVETDMLMSVCVCA